MNGSLVLSRQDSSNYLVIFVAMIIILILLLIYLVYKWYKKKQSSPEWIEMHKNLPTTHKNIEHVAKFAGLDRNEKFLLELMCRKFKAPNIEFLIRDEKAVDELCKKEFDYLNRKPDPEKMKSQLFTLRYKLERSRNSQLIITSTKSIMPGQDFSYTDERGSAWTFTLVENTPQGLSFSIPQTFANSSTKPSQMAKLNLTFVAKSGIAYILNVRLIRYETAKDSTPLMFAAHSNTLKALQRRNAKRMNINKKCRFAAVTVKAKTTSKGKEIKYIPKDNRYDGLLQDISATGCKILCNMDIQKGQYIYIEFPLESDTIRHSATGLIIKTLQTADNMHYTLHIKFIGIDIKVKNTIDSLIYNFISLNSPESEETTKA